MAFRNEAFSFFTHLVGALAGLVGLVFLLLRAESTAAIAAFLVYGVTLVAMFTSSTLHHVKHSDDGFFSRLDMSVIYLFIAGTYTPVCALALPAVWGVPVLVLVWSLAVGGVALRWLRPKTPRWVTVGLYLGLGWIALIGAYPLVVYLGWNALAFLVGGGIVYSVGAVIYARKRPNPWPETVGFHGLWHLFVMVAAGLHFALIWFFVPVS